MLFPAFNKNPYLFLFVKIRQKLDMETLGIFIKYLGDKVKHDVKNWTRKTKQTKTLSNWKTLHMALQM